MNTQDVISTIKSLPIKWASAEYEQATDAKISEAAEKLAPMLAARGLRIVKGGSSPSGSKTFTRIYLEPVTNSTHNHREHAYDVIRTWEWQTKSKYGFAPISRKSIRQMCDELVSIVAAM